MTSKSAGVATPLANRAVALSSVGGVLLLGVAEGLGAGAGVSAFTSLVFPNNSGGGGWITRLLARGVFGVLAPVSFAPGSRTLNALVFEESPTGGGGVTCSGT